MLPFLVFAGRLGTNRWLLPAGIVGRVTLAVSLDVMGFDPPQELSSWKEIAVYLGVGVRTAQTWERERGFPPLPLNE